MGNWLDIFVCLNLAYSDQSKLTIFLEKCFKEYWLLKLVDWTLNAFENMRILRGVEQYFCGAVYMLISFGLFDIAYSMVDMLVAMGSHSEGNTFSVFVSHGPFAEDLDSGFIALCVRCMFFSLSYGVLEVHFIYRYIALCKPKWIACFKDPKWLILLILGVTGQGIAWFLTVFFFLYADDEMRSFVEEPFRRNYNANAYEVPMLGSTYWGASNALITRSSIGILIVSLISCWAIYFCCHVGYTINKKLTENMIMSLTTKRMHRALLKALAIQTIIPFVISYMPCVVAWTVPIFHIDTGSLNNNTSVVAVSAFPFIDPLAIIFLIKNYRKSFLKTFIPCFYQEKIGDKATNATESERANTF